MCFRGSPIAESESRSLTATDNMKLFKCKVLGDAHQTFDKLVLNIGLASAVIGSNEQFSRRLCDVVAIASSYKLRKVSS